MITAILFVLTIILVAAALYVGLLLLRRSRPASQAGSTKPQTVGELVAQRSEPPAEDLSGTELFTPADGKPRTVTPPPPVAEPGADGGVAVPRPTPRPAATPPGGVPVGDAPWRRAARMMGSEPGGRWETAPVPVVPDAPTDQPGDVAPDAAGADDAQPGAAESRDAAPSPVVAMRPASAAAKDTAGRTLVVVPPPGGATPDDAAPEPQAADEVAPEEPAPAATAVWVLPEAVPTDGAPAPDAISDVPSHPLSDPDLTPLMGIPIVRPLGATPPVDTAVETPAAAEPAPQESDEPTVGPLRSPWRTDDDEVVLMVPAAAEPEPPVTGSPQPVWFRVVRRDGEPVGGALVSLLDDRGREADVTKTATDGGGELHAPHGGRFLMIASGEGFQPRAVILTVEEQPVEIALLLPRSAAVAGTVRVGDAVAAGARVVARQEGETVDEAAADREGHYRFGDLAEGVYAVSATDARGGAVREVTLSEGADLRLDLDLA